jgi:hypothetical protein
MVKKRTARKKERFFFYKIEWDDYPKLIASTGHSSTQAPQSTQSSVILAFPSSITIASVGHALTQASHPVHLL